MRGGFFTKFAALAQGAPPRLDAIARSVVIVVVDYIFLIHLETTTALCVPQKSRLKVEKRKKRDVYITSQFPFAIFHVAKFTKGLAKRNFITFYDFIV